MEKLLEMAKKVCDQAEVYSYEPSTSSVDFENAKLYDIESSIHAGVSLRIIKNGKLGFAYTRNILNRNEILQNALDSLKGKVEAKYDFPLTTEISNLKTYDSSIEDLTISRMVEELSRISEQFQAKTDAEISLYSYKNIEKIRVMNSKGTDINSKNGGFGFYLALIFPGGASSISRSQSYFTFKKTPQNLVNEMIEFYNRSKKVIEPKSGKMKVLWMPGSMHTLTWRILSGTSAKSIYEKISPIAEKIGEKIFNEKLTIHDAPLDDKYPWARAFDDEGVNCNPLSIIENGVLKSFYYDLNFAQKLDKKSTGHGYRTSRWGGEAIGIKPNPNLTHLQIKPGNASFSELLKFMDKGMIIEGAMGAHSGNIPNGDYSVGVSPGFYVENGEIIGRVKDAMVAGNVYDTLKNVVAIEDTLHPSWSGRFPAILCDDVSVATKK